MESKKNKPWQVCGFRQKCPGVDFKSYQPQRDEARRKSYLTASLSPVRTGLEQAMQLVLEEKKTGNDKFGGKEWMDRYGENTFEWPALHEVRQKPLDPFSMDSLQERMYLGRGAHMTLAMFISMPGGGTNARHRPFKEDIISVHKRMRAEI